MALTNFAKPDDEGKSMTWDELNAMDLNGRTLLVRYETLVQRGRITSHIMPSNVFHLSLERWGEMAAARNFTPYPDAKWRPESVLPECVSRLSNEGPVLLTDGTIRLHRQGAVLEILPLGRSA